MTTAFGRKQTFALKAFASQLACATHSFSFFTGLLLGWFFIEIPHFHFAEYAFTLEFLFQRLQGLINIVIADEYLHASIPKFVMSGLFEKKSVTALAAPELWSAFYQTLECLSIASGLF